MKNYIGDDAYAIYKLFKEDLGDTGSKAAKPNNIQTIIDILKEKNPRRVLELGGGNGTLTYAIAKHSNAHIDVYEPLEFCRECMAKNLSEFQGRYTVIDSYLTLPPHKEYDLIIVDGGEETGLPDVLTSFLEHLDTIDTIFIEGRRPTQRAEVRNTFRKRGVYRIVRHADVEYQGKRYAGGQEFRFYPSESRILRSATHLFWEGLLGINKAKGKLFS